MFLRAMCFFFLLFLKTKIKKTNKKTEKQNHANKKNGNDFDDKIKECLFLIFASYFTGREGGYPWGKKDR